MPNEIDMESLFKQHYDPTVRAVTATLGDRQLAEEAVQEGFVRAFSGIHKLREATIVIEQYVIERFQGHGAFDQAQLVEVLTIDPLP